MKVIAALLLASCSAHAEFVGGSDLASWLGDSRPEVRAVAKGYIVGIADAGHMHTHCRPAGTTSGQVIGAVSDSIKATPGIQRLSADVMVSLSLRATWPCSKGMV